MEPQGESKAQEEAEEAWMEEVDREVRRLRAFYLRLLRAAQVRAGDAIEVDNMQIHSNAVKIMASSQALLRRVHQLKAAALFEDTPALQQAVGSRVDAYKAAFEDAAAASEDILDKTADDP